MLLDPSGSGGFSEIPPVPPCLIVTVNGKLQQLNKNRTSEHSDPLEIKTWVTPTGKKPQPAKEKGTREQAVKEGALFNILILEDRKGRGGSAWIPTPSAQGLLMRSTPTAVVGLHN